MNLMIKLVERRFSPWLFVFRIVSSSNSANLATTNNIELVVTRQTPGSFRWESGGRYKNNQWNKELPTDSQIVMHCIATYLDSHLPRNPMYPEVCSHFTPPMLQLYNSHPHVAASISHPQCCSFPFHTQIATFV